MKYTKILLMGMILISSATYAQNDEVMRALENPSAEELINDDIVRPSTQSDGVIKGQMFDGVIRDFANPSIEELGNQNGRPAIETNNAVDRMSNVDMTIYPNPARNGNSKVSLRNLEAGEKKITINIVDSYGNIVRSEVIVTYETALEYALNKNSVMRPGSYFVSVTTGNISVRKQWMVE